jgi:hypothetical protein
MFGCEERRAPDSPNGLPIFPAGKRAVAAPPKLGWVETLSTGEEEVKVAKSEAPENTGAWCKREMLRSR